MHALQAFASRSAPQQTAIALYIAQAWLDAHDVPRARKWLTRLY